MEVVATDVFAQWQDELNDAELAAVINVIMKLKIDGVALRQPHSKALEVPKGTRVALRELRPQSGQSPLRIFYAFDPKRDAVLLLGGNKSSGTGKFYRVMIKRALKLWEQYLAVQRGG